MNENPYKVGDKVKILQNEYLTIPQGQIGEVKVIYNHEFCGVAVVNKTGREVVYTFRLSELEAIPAPEEEPLAEWERELLGLNDELKVGDRVKVNGSGPYGWQLSTGTITEKLGESSTWDFSVDVDNAHEVPFYNSELGKILDPRPDPEPEPLKVTPQYTGRELKVGDKVLILVEMYGTEGFRKGDVVTIKHLGVTNYRGEIGVTSGYAESSFGELHFHDYELELFEYHGVRVGDAVMTTNALNYGRVGTVKRLIRGKYAVDVAFDDGLLTPIAFAPHELIVLRDIDTSKMNEEYLFMVVREALVEAGKLQNESRTQIKKATEKGLQTIREYLAQRDAENQAKGYKRGKSDGSRAGYRVGVDDSVNRGVDDLTYLIIQAQDLINARHAEQDAA